MSNDILTTFWTNVDWHRKNKGMYWVELVGGNSKLAKDKQYNVTLNKVKDIANTLGIDDYAILFEEID